MKKRILTAIMAFIVFIPLVIIGGLTFQFFAYLLATIALIELVRMRQISHYKFPFILSVLFLWVLLGQDPAQILPGFERSEVIMLFVTCLLSYTVLAKNKFTFDDAGFILLTMIYVGTGFFYLIETRDGSDPTGLINIFFVLIVIWVTDTGAYFFGRSLGRRKLWPEISPNKTVEGAIGGIILSCIVGIIFHVAYPFGYDMITVVAVAILISIFGQIGDLVESAFKRHYDVKDSGKILPGHGGILDRLDSLIFVLPLLHFINFFS